MLRSAADSPVAVTAAAISGAAAAASTNAAGESGKPPPPTPKPEAGVSCGIPAGGSSGCQASGGGVQLSPVVVGMGKSIKVLIFRGEM